MKRLAALLGTLLALSTAGCGVAVSPSAGRPVVTQRVTSRGAHASTVILIIMEDRAYGQIVGNAQAPFINGTLLPQAALMTDSHAIVHPSQPNYLALFSGSTQRISDNSCPHTFSAANLGAEVIAAGKTFDGFSESMPQDGYTGCTADLYRRKHNPWVDFTNVPASSNLIWFDLPAPTGQPTVSIIVPNLCNDMRLCSTQTGDNWLKANLPAILQYDNANDGLLILTWDEAVPDADGQNRVATLLMGPMIVAGRYSQTIDHYAVLRTIEKVAGVACTANACHAPLITGIWR